MIRLNISILLNIEQFINSMDKTIIELERALLRGDDVGLERGALVASGIETRQELNRYLDIIDRLRSQIEGVLPDESDDVTRARTIFDCLWQSKPDRYEPQGYFRLTMVLAAQIGTSDKVGNCLGLTVLYNVLARRFKLAARAAYMEDAFGRGPHVFTVLDAGKFTIDIENIFPHGFDYQEHRKATRRENWGDRELIADIYHSIGNELAASRDLEGAMVNYDKSLMLYPQHNRARLNKGIALVEMGHMDEAAEWFKSQARF
jgi:tetratricopeptide (TPR) repeat protein